MGFDRRLALLTALYFCQGLPGGFLAGALPVILLQQGVELQKVGLISLLSLPWTLKILWAPLVDRFGSARFGRRKSWMVPAMSAMIVCTLAIAALDPIGMLPAVLVWFAALNLCAATQDIAVDGFAITLMRGRELGPANSAQVGGFKLGNLVGGGVLLALSGTLGWSMVFVIMAGCIGLALLGLLLTPEPADATDRPPAHTMAVIRRALGELVREPAYAAFLFAAKFGETTGGVLVKPAMVDHDFSVWLIGWIDGTFGSIATILGAVAGGALAMRRGWMRALVLMSAVQGLALLAIGVYTRGAISPLGFGVVLACENFAGGGVAVAVFMLAMSKCDRDIASSQFTAAQVLYMTGGAAAGVLSTAVADRIGTSTMIATGGVLALLVAIAAWRWRARIDPIRNAAG
jgi:MFS transporter, PAT family, beta-lactamase induction signal transducer AmpG